MICTFFGHKDASNNIITHIKEVIIDLIENKGVKDFYVGNHGNFDAYVRTVLCELQEKYPDINYTVVLAYLPKKEAFETEKEYNTIYPEQVAMGPAKFAISRRNEYMLNKSDYVVTFVHRIYGGAKQYKEKAERKGKIVINI